MEKLFISPKSKEKDSKLLTLLKQTCLFHPSPSSKKNVKK